MADLLTIEADASELIAALDRLGDEAERYVKEAARVTAERISQEAKRRVNRATGETAEAIHVEETYDKDGYMVLPGTGGASGRMRGHHVAQYLEFGTKHMTERPFFFQAARLEEGSHLRRTAQALQDAIDAQGLGS